LRTAALAYARECFGRETALHVNELARLLGIPSYQLSREFTGLLGEPPSTFFKRLQVVRAKRLLRFTDFSLNRVAYASGFGTRANFFRLFKQLTGSTPLEFRMSCTK
jgi:AraC-like DNA-binding protein